MRNQEKEELQNSSSPTPQTNSGISYYRNCIEIEYEGQSIDSGSLWKRNGNKLVLEDEDNFVEVDFNLNDFNEINL